MQGEPVRVAYIDGTRDEGRFEDWPAMRSDGVDSVTVLNPLPCTISGDSIYWLYPEGDCWVAGSGPVGYGAISPEVVLHPDGRQEARRIESMPDLPHSAVKLGWWRPGEARP